MTNYPFRKALLSFYASEISAGDAYEVFENLKEKIERNNNYFSARSLLRAIEGPGNQVPWQGFQGAAPPERNPRHFRRFTSSRTSWTVCRLPDWMSSTMQVSMCSWRTI